MHEEKSSHKFKYFIHLITRNEQQARKFIELYLEIWFLSKACKRVQSRNIFKMKLIYTVNVGESVAQVLVYVNFLPV